jgi:hypothetical protein
MAMDRKRIGVVVALAGVVLLILSAFADQFGYGDEGFGWLQTLGVIVGAVAIALGLVAIFWRGRASAPQPTT